VIIGPKCISYRLTCDTASRVTDTQLVLVAVIGNDGVGVAVAEGDGMTEYLDLVTDQ